MGKQDFYLYKSLIISVFVNNFCQAKVVNKIYVSICLKIKQIDGIIYQLNYLEPN